MISGVGIRHLAFVLKLAQVSFIDNAAIQVAGNQAFFFGVADLLRVLPEIAEALGVVYAELDFHNTKNTHEFSSFIFRDFYYTGF